MLLACEDRVLDLQAEACTPSPTTPSMTEAQEQDALDLLRDPQLLDRIGADVAALGVVGERDNALIAYLAATSRLLDTPLAVVVQSGSAAGKSTLTDAVLSLMPDEQRLTPLAGRACTIRRREVPVQGGVPLGFRDNVKWSFGSISCMDVDAWTNTE